MEPKIISEYSSDRAFHLHDASWYGGQCLLLRTFSGMFVGDAIDLIFLSTDYLELPFEVRGLRVSKPCDELAIQCQRTFAPHRMADLPEGERVFAIESEGKRFHVIASKLWVQVNTAPSETSSLVPMLLEDADRREAYLAQYVKEWYKIE